MAHLRQAPSTRLTFSSRGADYREDGGVLVGPAGPIADVACMRRRLPHDVTNALAASAVVLEPRLATPDGVAAALATFEGVAHRISLVADHGGISWYDDSKATTPHAAATAVRAFPSVVLLAGGKNKGLDLRALSEVARHGDTVLLSPACASFDWYGGYAERGEDFARAVRAHLGLR
jgi:UDP-N-acetylmuramoylalanine--D-glutamate ligase